MTHKIFESSDTNVKKFVFEKQPERGVQGIAVEAVLYRYISYKERTVICCSTQCGCPVGCVFCGTGRFFVRNLTADEIVEQVITVMGSVDCPHEEIKKFQIMFMSMGEPFLNYDNTEHAIKKLAKLYPNAQLLVSTSGPSKQTAFYFDRFTALCEDYEQIGIQFSVHESTDKARAKLIPTSSLTLNSIGELGEKWAIATRRRPFFNYCVHNENCNSGDVRALLCNFDPHVWECTLSVICEKDNTMQNTIIQKLELVNAFADKMAEAGYSLRVFNPAGQDDIGGGCGQLWYFQKWLANSSKKQ